jgi:acetyltransferase-like isoleucine patch superfamily enzyme
MINLFSIIKSILPYSLQLKLRKKRLLKEFSSVGENVSIDPRSTFTRPKEIEIGRDVFIGEYAYISSNLKIGNRVMFGPQPIILGGSNYFGVMGRTTRFLHYRVQENIEPTSKKDQEFLKRKLNDINKNIIIEDDVWCGARVTILSEGNLGMGCVIGAGSVVNKSIPPYVVAVGNPCKPVKKIFSDLNLKEHLLLLNVPIDIVERIVDRRKEELRDFWKSENLSIIDNSKAYYEAYLIE